MTLLFIGTTVLIFGGKKVPEMMRGLGKGVKSFKEGMNEPLEGKTEEAKDETAEPKPEDGAGQ